MRSVEIYINGRVQGVGFRYHTRQTANELEIKGYVRNLADGSVYIQASGNDAEVERFISWCRQGPRMAFVDSLKVNDISGIAYDNFSIR